MPLRSGASRVGLLLVALAPAACRRDAHDDRGAAASSVPFAPPAASAPVAPPADSAPPATPSFEVEFRGTLTDALRPAKRVFLVTRDPCDPSRLEAQKTIAVAYVPAERGKSFGVEATSREGALGYACGFAIDASARLIAFGQYAKNPLTFRAGGRDELLVDGVDIKLDPVAPRQLPKGLF